MSRFALLWGGSAHTVLHLGPSDLHVRVIGSARRRRSPRSPSSFRARAGDAVREHGLTLPLLQADAGTQDDPLWFAIEGMHGGFKCWWDSSAKRLRLMTESRTAAGARLLGQGFL